MVNVAVRRRGQEGPYEAPRWVSWLEPDDSTRTRIRSGQEGWVA